MAFSVTYAEWPSHECSPSRCSRKLAPHRCAHCCSHQTFRHCVWDCRPHSFRLFHCVLLSLLHSPLFSNDLLCSTVSEAAISSISTTRNPPYWLTRCNNPYLGKVFHPLPDGAGCPHLRGHPLKLLQTKKLPHTTFLVMVCNSFSVKWTKRKRPTCYG